MEMMNDENNGLDQVSIRLIRDRRLISDYPVKSPEDAICLVYDLLKDYDREAFVVVNLQSNLQPINLNIVSIGSIDTSIVSPRESLKSSILSNASKVLLLHNHPSGNLKPSPEDFKITERLIQSYNLLGMEVLDHIIIGNWRTKQYYSIKAGYTDRIFEKKGSHLKKGKLL